MIGLIPNPVNSWTLFSCPFFCVFPRTVSHIMVLEHLWPSRKLWRQRSSVTLHWRMQSASLWSGSKSLLAHQLLSLPWAPPLCCRPLDQLPDVLYFGSCSRGGFGVTLCSWREGWHRSPLCSSWGVGMQVLSSAAERFKGISTSGHCYPVSQFVTIWGTSLTEPWVITAKSLLQSPSEFVSLASFWLQLFHCQLYFLLSTPDKFANRNELPKFETPHLLALLLNTTVICATSASLKREAEWGQWLPLSSIIPGTASADSISSFWQNRFMEGCLGET